MNETTKTIKTWGDFERGILTGNGIDIGCGADPITRTARGFDLHDGDANEITKYVHEQFDFVYSSHCLEHMRDPRKAILEWWQLVKPGGHLFFIVPDEDLYEQGVFPSRLNVDHKATFTISKIRSWSPVSHNVLDLVNSLPGGRLVSLVLQDVGYNRAYLRHGPNKLTLPGRIVFRLYDELKSRKYRKYVSLQFLERAFHHFIPVDQTLRPDAMAQIQCIVRKPGQPGTE